MFSQVQKLRTISRGMPGVKKINKNKGYLILKIENRMPTHRTNMRIIEYSGPALPRRGGNSDFAMTIWRLGISDCKYVLLLVEVFAIDCSNAEFCA